MSETASRRRASAHLSEAAELLAAVSAAETAEIAVRIATAAAEGRAVFIIGNGGSAATADHFATDLSKNAAFGGQRVRAMSLVSNVALMTALANDLGYSRVFAEQLEVVARPGDVLVAISCSGNSPNILAGAEAAKARGLDVIGLCGFAGGKLRALCDLAVVVDASSVQLVEDVHMALTHAIAAAVRARFGETTQGEQHATPAVFIDRDGVVNVRRLDHVRRWEDFVFVPRAIEALAKLSAAGRRVFILTNQAVIGRDGLERRTVDEIHERALATLAGHGARIEAVLMCAHDPIESCGCRKPRPGLLLEAAERYQVDLARSVVIGDSPGDLAAARAAGCRAVLVSRTVSAAGGVPVAVDLLDAVERRFLD